MSSISPLTADQLAEQATMRQQLRAAGLPLRTTTADDYSLAWAKLEVEREVQQLSLLGVLARHQACAKAGLL